MAYAPTYKDPVSLYGPGASRRSRASLDDGNLRREDTGTGAARPGTLGARLVKMRTDIRVAATVLSVAQTRRNGPASRSVLKSLCPRSKPGVDRACGDNLGCTSALRWTARASTPEQSAEQCSAEGRRFERRKRKRESAALEDLSTRRAACAASKPA